MIKPQPYLLKNTIQHYEWGTKGNNAFIPQLLNIKSKKDKPYAELWMGAHPKSPSRIIVDGSELYLDEVIRQHPQETLGSKISKKFSNTLPFLFKVLSANEALSIQVHPHKRQAITLHKKDPENYPDDNHKLEIAIALDSLTALVGFKPYSQIIKTLMEYPEIREFIGEKYMRLSEKRHSEFISESQNLISVQSQMLKPVHHDIFNLLRLPHGDSLSNDDKKKFVKNIFTRLLKKSISDEETLASTIQALFERLMKKKNPTEIEKQFIELFGKYKNDIGVLIIFFLNFVHLKRGEAIFTKPGVPHAYLKGNILECMSSSDNVIRAGLTPKYKDLITLLNVLTFEPASPQILKGKKIRTNVVYKTEAKEFVINLYNTGKKNIDFKDQSGPRILLVFEGVIKFIIGDNGKNKQFEFSKGDSVFLPSILHNFQIASESKAHFVIVSVPA